MMDELNGGGSLEIMAKGSGEHKIEEIINFSDEFPLHFQTNMIGLPYY